MRCISGTGDIVYTGWRKNEPLATVSHKAATVYTRALVFVKW